MVYRSVSANAWRPGPAAANRAIVRQATARGDVVKLQEGNDPATLDEIRNLGAAWRAFIAPFPGQQNPIVWRHSIFELVAAGWTTIYHEKPGVSDGPDRVLTWVILRERATGKHVLEVNLHLIHQAFTKHPERRLGWRDSLARAAAYIVGLMARFPGVAVLISGDFNNPGGIDFPGLMERELASAKTYGSGSRYDRYFTVGPVHVSSTQTFPTASDHDAIRVTVSLTGPLSTPPARKPAPAKPLNRFQRRRLRWLRKLKRRQGRRFSTRRQKILDRLEQLDRRSR